jgi:hypothetical protein
MMHIPEPPYQNVFRTGYFQAVPFQCPINVLALTLPVAPTAQALLAAPTVQALPVAPTA